MRLVVTILGLFAAVAHGQSVQFAQPALSLAPGGSADVTVRLDQPFSQGLAAFGLKINYDPTRVAVSVTVVPELNHNFAGGSADIFTDPGEVSVLGMTEIVGDAFVSYDNLPLLTLHITDLTGGLTSSQITLTDFDTTTQWVSPAFDELDPLVSYGSPLTVATPEPTTLLALAPLALLRRRRLQR